MRADLLGEALEFQHGDTTIYPVEGKKRKDTNTLSRNKVDLC